MQKNSSGVRTRSFLLCHLSLFPFNNFSAVNRHDVMYIVHRKYTSESEYKCFICTLKGKMVGKSAAQGSELEGLGHPVALWAGDSEPLLHVSGTCFLGGQAGSFPSFFFLGEVLIVSFSTIVSGLMLSS